MIALLLTKISLTYVFVMLGSFPFSALWVLADYSVKKEKYEAALICTNEPSIRIAAKELKSAARYLIMVPLGWPFLIAFLICQRILFEIKFISSIKEDNSEEEKEHNK